VRVLEPSEWRRPHPCPQALTCGGCRFGVIPNRYQIQLKHKLLRDELKRNLGSLIGDSVLENISVHSRNPSWRYRWRAQIHVKKGRAHFKRFNSNELIPLFDCLLMARPLADSISDLCPNVPYSRLTIAASPQDRMARSEDDLEPLILPLTEDGLNLELPAGVFFQANWELNKELISYVRQKANSAERIADLYAGAGNFALPLANDGREVLAVEANPEAVDAAQSAASKLGLDSLEVAQKDLNVPESWSLLEDFAPESVIIDPPRLGGGKTCRALMDLSSLKKLTWVSCDLINTCRDLKPFLQQGWQIKEVALFDMFPQTWHLETVLSLEKPD
jgi:23S rRNA (uracil1939-C5)-methyltransferase